MASEILRMRFVCSLNSALCDIANTHVCPRRTNPMLTRSHCNVVARAVAKAIAPAYNRSCPSVDETRSIADWIRLRAAISAVFDSRENSNSNQAAPQWRLRIAALSLASERVD